MRFLSALTLLLPLVLAAPRPDGTSADGTKGDTAATDPRPLVDPARLQKTLTRKGLLNHAAKLIEFASKDPEGNRGFGGVGHNLTVQYIEKWFAQWPDYYDVKLQELTELYSAGTAALSVEGENLAVTEFTYSPSGKPTAELAVVNNLGCELSDFPPEVEGRIALISRGTCEFGLKVAYAGASGAVGAIIYNNVPGTIGGGTLGNATREQGPYVPVAGISQEDGQSLLADLEAGPVVASLDVFSINEERKTYNVLATTKGGDQNNVVQLGGHTDSIVGPGVNDNGSGFIAELEVAKALTRYKVKNAVRFSFWSAEEFGLLGAEYYVSNLPESERQKIRLYLNFDMIASPNLVYFIYDGDGSAFNLTGPPGSDQIEHLFADFYKKNNLPSSETAFDGRSDYGPFLELANIPSGGLFTGAEGIKTVAEAELYGGTAGEAYDPNYHGKGDDFKNVDADGWLINTKAVAYSIATYARSLKGFPERQPPVGNFTAPVRKRHIHARDEVNAFGEIRVRACGHGHKVVLF